LISQIVNGPTYKISWRCILKLDLPFKGCYYGQQSNYWQIWKITQSIQYTAIVVYLLTTTYLHSWEIMFKLDHLPKYCTDKHWFEMQEALPSGLVSVNHILEGDKQVFILQTKYILCLLQCVLYYLKLRSISFNLPSLVLDPFHHISFFLNIYLSWLSTRVELLDVGQKGTKLLIRETTPKKQTIN
jgi:hypothetical protein